MSRKKIIIIAVVAIVVLIAGIITIRIIKANKKSQIIVTVQKGDFEVNVTTTGELKSENFEQIKGPMELRLIGVWNVKITDLVPEGTLVDSGDYVATLDRTEATDKLKTVESELEKIQSQYTKTKLDTNLDLRASRDELVNLKYTYEEKKLILEQSKYEPPATVRQAEIDVERAKRNYQQAVENYQLKKKKAVANMSEVSASLNQQELKRENLLRVLDKFVITAPKSGMVIYNKEWGGSKRKVGSTISSWDPTVATLPDLSTMVSKTYVNEIDISKIKVGQTVKIGIDAFPGKFYTGKVKEVANIGEQLPNTDAKVFEVMIKIDQSDSILRPAMSTSNLIQIGMFKEVLFIPLDAIVTNDTMSYVYKLEGLKKVKQIIWPGESNENSIIVLKGLNEGDKLLLNPPADPEKLKFTGLEIYEEVKKDKELNKKKQTEQQKQNTDKKNNKKHEKVQIQVN
jgi:multidrug efflux pump subunit AcrA (membrane-fusion protein)